MHAYRQLDHCSKTTTDIGEALESPVSNLLLQLSPY
ncbi:unnamed protein product, partial [Didymodactylos carnosus]